MGNDRGGINRCGCLELKRGSEMLMKKGILAGLIWIAITATASAASAIVAFGDSITYGHGVPAANVWVTELATALNLPLTNNAVSGGMAADISYQTYGTTPMSSTEYLVMIGTNDAEVNGSDLGRMTTSVAFLEDLIVYYAAPTKVTGRTMALTGTWTNTGSEPLGIGSQSAGSTATAVVQGTSVYISTVLFAGSSNVLSITIDGASYGSTVAGNSFITTQLGRGWAPAVTRISGLTSGSHTVVLTVPNNNWAYVDFVAGNTQSTTPAVRVADVIRRGLPAYANGNSDANVAEYGAIYSDMVAALASDGLNVKTAPIAGLLNPFNDLLLDDLHPNISGHQHIEGGFLSVF